MALLGLVCLVAGWAGPADSLYTTAQFRRDAGALFTWENLGFTAVGLGASGIAHSWDDAVQRRVGGYDGAGPLLAFANRYGQSSINLPVSLGVWVAASATGPWEARAASADVLRALGFSQVVVGPLKRGVGRQRPDHSNRFSFPSGHAANACAVAGVLTRRYGWRAGVPLYLLVPVVSVARIAGDRHYLADVVAGAAVGSIVGCSLPLTDDRESMGWAPARPAGGRGLVLRFRI